MARRRFDVFNLAFLDVMACGLGAIILFYMIISAQVAARSEQANIELVAETDRLSRERLIHGSGSSRRPYLVSVDAAPGSRT